MKELPAGTVVEYRNSQHTPCIANGRRATIVRQCAKQGNARQYIVRIVSCPDHWTAEHKAQQIGKLHFWWDGDFIVVSVPAGL